MSQLWQIVISILGSSGITALIVTTVVTRVMNKHYAKQDRQDDLNRENQLLMMMRVDNLSEMTNLMAKKLHDAGIINGDLEEMHQKYKGLDAEYSKNIKRLALEVLEK